MYFVVGDIAGFGTAPLNLVSAGTHVLPLFTVKPVLFVRVAVVDHFLICKSKGPDVDSHYAWSKYTPKNNNLRTL